MDKLDVELLTLIKKDTYLLQLALEKVINEYDRVLFNYPNDPDANDWEQHIVHLQKIYDALGKYEPLTPEERAKVYNGTR